MATGSSAGFAVTVHDRGFVPSAPQPLLDIVAAPDRYDAWWPHVRRIGDPSGAPVLLFPGLGRVHVAISFERVSVDPGVVLHLDGPAASGHLEWWLQPTGGGTIANVLLGLTRAARWGRRTERAYRSAVRDGLVSLRRLGAAAAGP